jgi:hypothetical protein
MISKKGTVCCRSGEQKRPTQEKYAKREDQEDKTAWEGISAGSIKQPDVVNRQLLGLRTVLTPRRYS